MPVLAISAALLSAFVHASWNALLKAGKDRVADSFWVAVGWLVVGIAIAFWKGAPQSQMAWMLLVISAIVHAFYWAALIRTYGLGDLSHVYTLSRGLAPSMATLGAFVFARETPGVVTLCGMGLVCAGVLSVGLSRNAPLEASLWAVLIAALIGTYSFVDAFGAREVGDAVLYLAWNLGLSAIPILVFTLILRPGAVRPSKEVLARGLGAGAVSALGYGLALFAQTKAHVAQVTALRETSVVFAALMAWLVLGERLGPRRWGGVALVAAGALCAAFG